MNRRARRALAGLHPLKVIIENYPHGQVEYVDAVNTSERQIAVGQLTRAAG